MHKEGQFNKNVQRLYFPKGLCCHSLWRHFLFATFPIFSSSLVVKGPPLPGHHTSMASPEIGGDTSLITVNDFMKPCIYCKTSHFTLWPPFDDYHTTSVTQRDRIYRGFNTLVGGWWGIEKRDVGGKGRAVCKEEQVAKSSQFLGKCSCLLHLLFPDSTFQLVRLR